MFINLGHVKDGEVNSAAREAIAEVKAEVTPSASVEGGGSGIGPGTVKPKPKRKPVRRTKEPVRVELQRVEPVERGGFLSGLIKRHFSGVGDDL